MATFDTSDFVPDKPGFDTSDFVQDAPATTAVVPTTTKPAAPQVSATEAGGRGFANSASFGLGKWVNAIAGATLNRIDKDQGDVVSSITASTPNTGQGFWADVTNSVEGQKAANAVAMQQHPVAYIAGSAAPLAVGGVVNATTKGLGLGLGKLTAGIALPTTVRGSAALGATLGAEGGLAESTNLKQAEGNVAVGTVLGGVLGGAGAGLTNMVKSYGIKATQQVISDALDSTRSSNPIISNAAFDKLGNAVNIPRWKLGQSLPSGAPVTQKIIDASNDEIVQEAQHLHSVLQRAQNTTPAQAEFLRQLGADPNIGAKAVKLATSALSPSTGQVLREGAGTVVKAGIGGAVGSEVGHLAEGLVPGSGPIVGAMIGAGAGGWKAGQQFAGDLADYGAMRYAGSSGAQSLLSTSPLVGGNVAGSNLGLNGMLGNYIDSTWRSR